VQSSRAAFALTTYRWISQGDRRADAGFLQINPPFKGKIQPIEYVSTPTKDRTMFTIVGYRGDQSLQEELGAQMYRSGYVAMDYDLAKEPHLLQYAMTGQPGSPLIRQWAESSPSIHGTHCGQDDHGGYGNAIGRPHGQTYLYDLVYRGGLGNSDPGARERLKIRDLTKKPLTFLIGANPEPEQNFGNLVQDIAQAAGSQSPLFGALGPSLSAVAGIALISLARTISTAGLSVASQPVVIGSPDAGALQRATFSEAALQGLLSLQAKNASSSLVTELTDSARQKYNAAGFTVTQASIIGSRFLTLLLQAALRIVLARSNPKAKTGNEGLPAVSKPDLLPLTPEAKIRVLSVASLPLAVLGMNLTKAAEAKVSKDPKPDGKATTVVKDGKETKPDAKNTSAKPDAKDTKSAGTAAPTPAQSVIDKNAVSPQPQAKDNLKISDEKAAILLVQRAIVAECVLFSVLELLVPKAEKDPERKAFLEQMGRTAEGLKGPVDGVAGIVGEGVVSFLRGLQI
jgi:hypothetical protein